MNISIEISFDLTGYSQHMRGEHIVASQGDEINHNSKQLNSTFNYLIREQCEDRVNHVSFITFYSTKEALIICKKFTDLSQKDQRLTKACSQILISIPKAYDYKKALSSVELLNILFDENYIKYIKYTEANRKPFPLSLDIKRLNGNIDDMLYTEQTSVYEIEGYEYTFLSKKLDERYLFFLLLSKYNFGNCVSILSTDINPKDSTLRKFNLNERKVYAKVKPTQKTKVVESISMESKTFDDTSLFQLEKMLKLTQQSIELDLNIIKTLSVEGSHFFSKNKLDKEKINVVLDDTIKSLKTNKTLNSTLVSEILKRMQKNV